jgi:N-acetylmuramoyl-L-alanine amidase
MARLMVQRQQTQRGWCKLKPTEATTILAFVVMVIGTVMVALWCDAAAAQTTASSATSAKPATLVSIIASQPSPKSAPQKSLPQKSLSQKSLPQKSSSHTPTSFILAFNRACTADEPSMSAGGKRVTLGIANAKNGITSLEDLTTALQTSVKGLTDVLCVESPALKSKSNSKLVVTFVMAQAVDSCALTGNGTSKLTLTLHTSTVRTSTVHTPTLHTKSPLPPAKSSASSTLPSSSTSPKPNTRTPTAGDTNTATTAATVAKPKNKWALDVIVLDAGHGGKDAGAVGVTGVKEKDVVLAIVKKLGALIKKNMAGTKVVFTRSDDTFIELDRRGQIANEAGGKLFVSVHCNSTPKKPAPASGFEVYILRPGKSEEAVQVAEFENSVVRFESDAKRYKKLTDEQFIIINMAQSSFVKFSDKFASLLVREVGKSTTLPVRGVSQAGFYVLVGASMPNVLIETAFVSNKKDEKYLKSESGQQQLAQGMFNAIKAYRDFYEKQLQRDEEPKK